jgi:hypothetical protein
MDRFLRFLVIALFLIILFHIALLLFTRFERQITVKTNTVFGSGSGRALSVSNMVSDEQGHVYKVQNVLLLLKFRAAETQAALKPGETFTVRGYGLRIPWLGLYPTIYEVVA